MIESKKMERKNKFVNQLRVVKHSDSQRAKQKTGETLKVILRNANDRNRTIGNYEVSQHYKNVHEQMSEEVDDEEAIKAYLVNSGDQHPIYASNSLENEKATEDDLDECVNYEYFEEIDHEGENVEADEPIEQKASTFHTYPLIGQPKKIRLQNPTQISPLKHVTISPSARMDSSKSQVQTGLLTLEDFSEIITNVVLPQVKQAINQSTFTLCKRIDRLEAEVLSLRASIHGSSDLTEFSLPNTEISTKSGGIVLPIKELAEFESFDAALRTDIEGQKLVANAMLQTYNRHAKNTLSHVIVRFIKVLMVKKVAMCFNGQEARNGKKPFKQTTCYQIMKEIIYNRIEQFRHTLEGELLHWVGRAFTNVKFNWKDDPDESTTKPVTSDEKLKTSKTEPPETEFS